MTGNDGVVGRLDDFSFFLGLMMRFWRGGGGRAGWKEEMVGNLLVPVHVCCFHTLAYTISEF